MRWGSRVARDRPSNRATATQGVRSAREDAHNLRELALIVNHVDLGPDPNGKVTQMAARPRPRPRFSLSSRLPPAQVCARVNAKIKADPRLRGIALEQHIELAIDGDEHHFWSPQLVLQVREAEDGGTLLEARFGPDPYVWALYLFSYGALLVLTFWALIFGVVQWTLGQTPTALWAAPALALLAALVYGASFVGQGLGAEQMYFLRATMADLCESGESDRDEQPG